MWGTGLVIQKSMWTHHNEGSRLLYTDFERHYYCYECDQKLQKEMCVCMCVLAYAFESELYKWLRIVPTKGRLCDRVKRLVTGQDFCFRHECLCMHSFLPIWASSLRCKSTEIHKNTWNRLDDIKALSGQGVGQIVCAGEATWGEQENRGNVYLSYVWRHLLHRFLSKVLPVEWKAGRIKFSSCPHFTGLRAIS